MVGFGDFFDVVCDGLGVEVFVGVVVIDFVLVV